MGDLRYTLFRNKIEALDKGHHDVVSFFWGKIQNICKYNKKHGVVKIVEKNRKFKTILFSYYYVILHNIYKAFIKKMQEP